MTPPVTREVLVNATPERAFDLFTENINAWWPLDGFGVFNDGTVAFEGELLVERSGDRESVWGEVLVWEPAASLALTWHPGSDPQNATEVRVTFTAVADQTLVTLVHSGWERLADPEAAAAEYGAGWPLVLARFRELTDEVAS